MLPRCWPWSRVSQPREDAAPTPGSPPAPRPVKSWAEIPDFDNVDEEIQFWETHDAALLFGWLPWWRRTWLRIWAGFWYAVGFAWGLFTKRS